MSGTKRNKTHIVKNARLDFADYLRERRLEAGLSQMDVAKKLKLKNAQFISNIERGLAPVPFQQLKVLKRLYDISFKELLGRYTHFQKSVFEASIPRD